MSARLEPGAWLQIVSTKMEEDARIMLLMRKERDHECVFMSVCSTSVC